MYRIIVSTCIMGMLALGLRMDVRAQEGAEPIPGQENVQEQTPAPEKISPTIEVAESALCTGVEEHQPVGSNTVFSSDVGKIYFWTKITGAQEPTQIKHVWYYKDTQIADVTLNINFPSHRTWSYKTILPELVGSWKVEVLDANAEVLKKVDFTITETQQEPVAEPLPAETPQQIPAVPEQSTEE